MLARAMGRVGTAILLVVLAAAVGWIVFAATTNATLITFRTGSMAPTMPQGALAVSLPVRADELKVGNVVTVQREERSLPVTHRVVHINSVENPPAGPALPGNAREVILKGDANDHPDARPYIITDARRVVFSLPRLGSWFMMLQSPPAMGLLIVGAGILTTWAFWPRPSRK